jgi:hypothetical protein
MTPFSCCFMSEVMDSLFSINWKMDSRCIRWKNLDVENHETIRFTVKVGEARHSNYLNEILLLVCIY